MEYNKIVLDKKVFLDLLNSHTCFTESEYHKEGSIVTNDHFAIKAEKQLSEYLRKSDQWWIMEEFSDYSIQHLLDITTGEEF